MNADPRRPDKIQRYVPTKNSSNAEDLTPDYMNIMGQAPPTTANAEAIVADKRPDQAGVESNHQNDAHPTGDELNVTTNAANVIPTSPQYGVAIIPNNNLPAVAATGNETSESATMSTDPMTEAAKGGEDAKDIHTTPSRNDRFKVVKIASLEPFKRGRWKCMDYVDEAPPPNVVNNNANNNKTPQSVGNNALPTGVYLQTQSLPQQQIQQMLLQGGFTNGTQFFPNMSAQLIPQGQYFYPQVQNQNVPQPVATSMPTQFIGNQPYFAAGVVTNPAGFTLPQGYPNIQYVPIPAQNSAFVPTTQAVHLPPNFQQSQSYAGQPTVSQANITQNMMNGHAFPQHSEPQVQGSTMPNQPAKNVIVNHTSQPANVTPAPQQQYQQQPQPAQSGAYPAPTSTTQQQQQQSGAAATAAQSQNSVSQTGQNLVIGVVPGQPQQNFDASNVYTNPQFTMSVNSLTVLDANETGADVKDTNSAVETVSENSDDPNKSNPVVNAIDNKIEQAMDLVKSHLMYTVREEVEVLKEKIAELMERIQQLETENNYLRSQIPKNQAVAPPPATSAPAFNQQPQNIAVVNPSPSVLPSQNPIPSQPNQQTIPNSSAAMQHHQQQQQQPTSKEPAAAPIQ